MENNNYNSLAQKLIQDGILNNEIQKNENFFESTLNISKPKPQVPQKRINEYDNELIKDKSTKSDYKKAINIGTIASLKILKENSKTANLFFKLFPNLKKAKNTKEALMKLSKLNLDVKKLLENTVPYGESETRYDNLIKYLESANELQTKLKK